MPVYLRKKRLRVEWSGKLTRATIVFKSIADSRSSAWISKIVKQTIQSRADYPLISFIRLVRYFGVIPSLSAKYATSLLGECSSTTVRMNRNASSSLWV